MRFSPFLAGLSYRRCIWAWRSRAITCLRYSSIFWYYRWNFWSALRTRSWVFQDGQFFIWEYFRGAPFCQLVHLRPVWLIEYWFIVHNFWSACRHCPAPSWWHQPKITAESICAIFWMCRSSLSVLPAFRLSLLSRTSVSCFFTRGLGCTWSWVGCGVLDIVRNFLFLSNSISVWEWSFQEIGVALLSAFRSALH